MVVAGLTRLASPLRSIRSTDRTPGRQARGERRTDVVEPTTRVTDR
jgi:hypothetical protein